MDKCIINKLSSKVCEYGTKSCVVNHNVDVDNWIEKLVNLAKKSVYYSEGDLYNNSPYTSYDVCHDTKSVCLDGDFTINQLKALIKHMEEYSKDDR